MDDKTKEERQARLKEYWMNLPKFEKPGDVPTIPHVDEKEYREFYVPKLIAAGAIAKADLVDGQCYLGEYRNANYGKWNAKENVFELLQCKIKIQQAVLRGFLILGKFSGPIGCIERRQGSCHHIPFGNRESRTGQPCNTAQCDLNDDHGNSNEQPNSHGSRSSRYIHGAKVQPRGSGRRFC